MSVAPALYQAESTALHPLPPAHQDQAQRLDALIDYLYSLPERDFDQELGGLAAPQDPGQHAPVILQWLPGQEQEPRFLNDRGIGGLPYHLLHVAKEQFLTRWESGDYDDWQMQGIQQSCAAGDGDPRHADENYLIGSAFNPENLPFGKFTRRLLPQLTDQEWQEFSNPEPFRDTNRCLTAEPWHAIQLLEHFRETGEMSWVKSNLEALAAAETVKEKANRYGIPTHGPGGNCMDQQCQCALDEATLEPTDPCADRDCGPCWGKPGEYFI